LPLDWRAQTGFNYVGDVSPSEKTRNDKRPSNSDNPKSTCFPTLYQSIYRRQIFPTPHTLDSLIAPLFAEVAVLATEASCTTFQFVLLSPSIVPQAFLPSV